METQPTIIRVKTGEDVLCNLVEKTDAGYKIKDPMALIPTPDGRLAFIGWMPYAEQTDGLFIPADFVWMVTKPDAQIETQYRGFKTGLVTPNKNVAAPAFNLVGAQ
jgi:hypothetical protein